MTMALDLRSSELEYNFMKERIINTDNHFSDISTKLSSYIKKVASLRDCGDDIAKCVSNYASKETYNHSLRLCLGEFSDVLCSVQEYRDVEVNRTQVKVKDGFKCYPQLCSDAKSEIKKCFDARVKELKKKNELEKARSKTPPNWQKIAQAEKEVNQAQEEAARLTQAMVKLVERFERKKIEDLKNGFLEFVKIEMIFHAKAIELYTKSYNILKEIKVEEDLQEFTSHFKAHSPSLDAGAFTPANHNTAPKMIEENTESSSCKISKPQLFLSGMQGTPRSVHTLKSTIAISPTSNSSPEGYGASNTINGSRD